MGDVEISGWDKPYISIEAEKNIDPEIVREYGKKSMNRSKSRS